jgi:hypothetical protein
MDTITINVVENVMTSAAICLKSWAMGTTTGATIKHDDIAMG